MAANGPADSLHARKAVSATPGPNIGQAEPAEARDATRRPLQPPPPFRYPGRCDSGRDDINALDRPAMPIASTARDR